MDQRLAALGIEVIHKLSEALPDVDNKEGFQLRMEFFGYLVATLFATIPDAASRNNLIEAFAVDLHRVSDSLADLSMPSLGIH